MTERDDRDPGGVAEEPAARWIREHAARSFAPGFADRVMRRIAEERAAAGTGLGAGFDGAITALFPRLAAAALALIVIAGAYCLWGIEDRSPLEALVGLPTVSIEDAYDLGSDLVGGASESVSDAARCAPHSNGRGAPGEVEGGRA
jgi:hypothetical protein